MTYTPNVYYNPGVIAGGFTSTPMGIILHGSRSGVNQSIRSEFDGTRRYAVNDPDGYGWNVTIGDDEISIHMTPTQWGWNARAASSHYLAVEFAQGVEAEAISDGQVRAFVWWVRNHVLPQWPKIDLNALPTHAELDGTPIYGGYHDGKSDVFSKGSARTTELRARIHQGLGEDAPKMPPTIEDVLSWMGYLTVDVANALQSAHDGALTHLKEAQSASDGRTVKHSLSDLSDDLSALQAAINTLKSYKPS